MSDAKTTATEGGHKLPSLYDLTDAMIDVLNSADATEEQIEAAFGQLQEKGQNYCAFRADVKGDIAKFKAEEDRIANRRKAMENLVDRLETYMEQAMERLEISELSAGTFNIKLQNNPPALVVGNEAEIPGGYYTIIPATKVLDKARVRKDLAAKIEVKGVHLHQGKHIVIR